MSAVAGIYFRDERQLDRASLTGMLESLAHRGPDRSDLWFRGFAGLGHRMLSTTPESLLEKVPLVSESGDIVITADARIDNRHELIAALDLGSRPCSEIPDSELILRAYGKWGESCPEQLLGDFAFAIWDEKGRTFFCARDHFGVKPFYYFLSDRAFIFASEIKGVLRLPEVPHRLNEERVADYLVPIFEDKEVTFYRDIVRLAPAHSLTVGRHATRLRPYWSLDRAREIRYRADEEYAEAFRETFTEAVRCRLRSALPVGSMLSGGLDSSSIVCVAQQLVKEEKRPLHTFSATFDDVPECDERQFISAVVMRAGLRPHYVPCDRLSPLADLDNLLRQQDEVFNAPNISMHQALCGAAKNQGIRVLLDGIDGDTTVSHGLLRLAELLSTGRLRALAGEVTQLSRHFNRNRWRMLWSYGLSPLVPLSVRKIRRAFHGRNRRVRSANPTLNPDFVRRINLAERLAVPRPGCSKPARTARDDQWRRITSGMFPCVFEVVDKAAAVFPLELRHPFFDRRLVEFCLALPSEQKLLNGWTRMIMRRGLANTLPDTIRWRGGKTYLGPSFTRALLKFERPVLEAFVLKPPKMIDAYLDTLALRRIYERYLLQKRGEDALTIWKAVTLGRWLQQTELTV
jgi:asparagine synthase (glutamine-hydrolysing)